MIVKLRANYINDFYTQVNYKASEEKGFEILPGSTILENGSQGPRDSVAVQRAKAQHAALYHEIAATHQAAPVPYPIRVLQDTKAVKKKKNSLAEIMQLVSM